MSSPTGNQGRSFHPWGWIALSAAFTVSILAALLMLPITNLLADDAPESARSSPTSAPATPTPATSPSPSPSDTPAASPSSVVSTTDPSPSTAPVIDQIIVTADLSRGVRVGNVVAPDTYQLVEWGDEPTVYMSYEWEGRSTGVAVEGELCGMVARVNGPGDPPDMRSALCSKGTVSQFNNDGSNLTLTRPGRYTITVRDTVSGAEGKTSFEVVT